MFPTPQNFSWLVDGVLAGLAHPSCRGTLEYLIKHGIKHIITLTEAPLSATIDLEGLDLTYTHIPINDLTAPSIEQVKEFLSVVEDHNNRNQVSVAVVDDETDCTIQ